MNEKTNTAMCEHNEDLISFLYGEANEREIREFERHLTECTNCRSELNSFGVIRNSIDIWKTQALSGFVASSELVPVKKKSAIAALREFFDLSPLWLKAGMACATLFFCVLAVIMLGQLGRTPPTQATVNPPDQQTNYSQKQVDEIVARALAEQKASIESQQAVNTSVPKGQKIKISQPAKSSGSTNPLAKGRKLTRAEREQLAADLRLLTRPDDDDLDLIGDRINQ
jgi:hypothetical protein